ncbi:hypothetical protein LCGC14_1080650 [marine sediment metagenome]|uniref:Uncharacterized protein n=1 Tax=marine sediment metagenome TaxID=412755 RepID=A0A0F9PYH6_9ZZZZ
MTKKGQSILDFLYTLPLDVLNAVPRAPVSNKEAQSLYNIWKGDKDDYGRSLIPNEVDPLQVAALTSKGMVKSHPISLSGIKAVDITAKGKEIIRNIILHSEESFFGKSSERIDYETIHQAVLDGPQQKTADKVASNWLKSLKWN